MNDAARGTPSHQTNAFVGYRRRCAAMGAASPHPDGRIRLQKTTISNLFRYGGHRAADAKTLSLQDFNHVLDVDPVQRTLDVEGLATYQSVVARCLPLGLLPTVTPELKHITVGGATVGIGIESSGHRHGFVHDGLLEADVLLPHGEIVTCRADNEHADLFRALPNSYGTLGYILRARIRLTPAKRYVRLDNIRYADIDSYLDALEAASGGEEHDFVEGLFYSDSEQYLTLGRYVDETPYVDGIYGSHIFYKELRAREQMYLTTEDYIFRFDPDWFWNIPDAPAYMLFRRLAPKRLRNSGFYQRYVKQKHRLRALLRIPPDRSKEQLIQDWEVPWPHAKAFTHFVLANVDIQGQPWVALPIRSLGSPTLYPLRADTLYFNVGCYCFADRPRPDIDYYYTRLLDEKCFELGGIKMLYSSTFVSEPEFDRIYNGDVYRELKRKYDPEGLRPTLYEKAVGAG